MTDNTTYKVKLNSNKYSIGRLTTCPADTKLGWNIAIAVPYRGISKSKLKPGYVYDIIELDGVIYLQELGESFSVYKYSEMAYNQDCLVTMQEVEEIQNG